MHRKRFIYAYHCHNGPGISTPLTVDITGTYFRREGLGGMYICGASPESEVSFSQGAYLLSVLLFIEMHVKAKLRNLGYVIIGIFHIIF